jgi:hypothetical protein
MEEVSSRVNSGLQEKLTQQQPDASMDSGIAVKPLIRVARTSQG